MPSAVPTSTSTSGADGIVSDRSPVGRSSGAITARAVTSRIVSVLTHAKFSEIAIIPFRDYQRLKSGANSLSVYNWEVGVRP